MKMSNHTFTDPDLAELDRIWPLGRQLVVPDDGTIVVAGAYEGRYLRYLSDLFPTAKVWGFEPQATAFLTAQERCKDNLNIRLFSFGLATSDRYIRIGNAGTDGASVATLAGKLEGAQFRDAVVMLNSTLPIDLLVLNAEGSEWALLPYLLDEMMHHRIRSMAIQFHPKYVSIERCNRVVSYIREYYTQAYFDWPHWCYFVRKD